MEEKAQIRNLSKSFSKLKFLACGCFSQCLYGFTGNGSSMRFFLTQTCKILSKSSCVFTKSIHMFEKTYFAPTEKQILRQVLWDLPDPETLCVLTKVGSILH